MESIYPPTIPVMALSNYIECLDEQLRIILSFKLIEYSDIQHFEKRLCDTLHISDVTLRKYVKTNRFPISFIKQLDKYTYEDVFRILENEQPTLFAKWKNVDLPQNMTPLLAYYLGYLQGDGAIESNKRRISFSDESRCQLERINDLTERLFSVSGVIRPVYPVLSKKPSYSLSVGSYVLNEYFHKYFKINRGIKTNLQVPPHILLEQHIRWYLVGLYDADGTLPKNPYTCKQQLLISLSKTKG